ncbi:MAG: phosphatase PAP2 family protein [Pseudohongiellaceae bacterium]
MYRTLLAIRRLADLDTRIFLGINAVHDRLRLRRLSRTVSWSGDGYCYAVMALILPGIMASGERWLIAGLLGFLIELPIYWLLKNAFRRRRPFAVVKALQPMLKPSDEFSFPSGHTTAAFMVAYITTFHFPVLGIPMYAWASAIGLSRVALKVHFVSDIVAGMIIGTGIGAFSLWLIEL